METFKISTYGREGSSPVLKYKYVQADSFFVNDGDLVFITRNESWLNTVAAFAKGQWIDVSITSVSYDNIYS